MPNDDLISRKALLENYDLKNATKYGNKTEEQLHNSYSTLMRYEIADMIMDAPAVDAEPVKHSEWVEGKDRVRHWHCRECGLIEGMAHYMMHYCPNCGAKMDKSP